MSIRDVLQLAATRDWQPAATHSRLVFSGMMFPSRHRENRGFWSPFDGLKASNNVPQNKHTDKSRTGETDSLRRMQMLGGDSE